MCDHGERRERHGQTAYRAVLCDLLSALLDSWSIWQDVTDDADLGLRWRTRCLDIVAETSAYVPYEQAVTTAADDVGLPEQRAGELLRRWPEIRPWPETRAVLADIARDHVLGIVTNCSEQLGRQAVAGLGIEPSVLVTAERVGRYKPDAEPYLLALGELGMAPHDVLYLAGSRHDVAGASAVGMTVYWHNRIGQDPPPGHPDVVGHPTLHEVFALLRPQPAT